MSSLSPPLNRPIGRVSSISRWQLLLEQPGTPKQRLPLDGNIWMHTISGWQRNANPKTLLKATKPNFCPARPTTPDPKERATSKRGALCSSSCCVRAAPACGPQSPRREPGALTQSSIRQDGCLCPASSNPPISSQHSSGEAAAMATAVHRYAATRSASSRCLKAIPSLQILVVPPMRIARRTPDSPKFNQSAELPRMLRLEDFGLACRTSMTASVDANTHRDTLSEWFVGAGQARATATASAPSAH